MVNTWVVAMILSAALAEWAHARRVGRIGPLAFGPTRRPRGWTRLVAPARVAALAGAYWGFHAAWSAPPPAAPEEANASPRRGAEPRLLIVLDVSPSMYLCDSGPSAAESRLAWATQILSAEVRKIPEGRVPVCIVAFYCGAPPARAILPPTRDVDLVLNTLDRLPVAHIFPTGKTDLFGGLSRSLSLVASWPERSTLFVVVTDGDTEDDGREEPLPPPSIARSWVLGVGSPGGRQIAGHLSRQECGRLRSIAERLNACYVDANCQPLPVSLFGQLAYDPADAQDPLHARVDVPLRAPGILAFIGGLALAAAPILLSIYGVSVRPGP
jgi:Mg-chelatase subunit ChlD